ncbi:hypothetical protein GGI23_003510 [Coemansia sp. RSA 2559]|nr:hypothetical protein GGI23_003510 [Coemansia sp. RSA 2559]KAJ2857518.1 hypothetical protein GGI22_003496 [Coemansia erecta]
MSGNSGSHRTSPAVNSSAIAGLSSWSKDVNDSPINQLLNKIKKSGTSSSNSPTERVAKRIDTSSSNSEHCHKNREYVCLLDIVRAYLETDKGEQGSELQVSQFKELLTALVESNDCFDVAAVAFFATLHRNTLDPHIESQIESAIKRHTRDSGIYDESEQLEEVYSRFLRDADRCRKKSASSDISVLDIRRFAYNCLYRSSHYYPSFAFHWIVDDIDRIPEDALSEQFYVHGIKCKLRFCKKITLTNGETWTGMWLHNVSSGCKVLAVRFALVASNLAYPTICHTQVVNPTDGIRPSQGIGVKLFAKLGDLTRRIDSNKLPIIECNSIRLSVVYI